MKRREFLSHAGSAAMVTALSPGLLSSCAAREKSPAAPGREGTAGLDLTRPLSEIERDIVRAVYREEGMNQTRTAERLNISRSTVWRILKD